MDSNQQQNTTPKPGIYQSKPAVANIGIMLFYQALEAQGCRCTQINWIPAYQQSEEIEDMLDEFL